MCRLRFGAREPMNLLSKPSTMRLLLDWNAENAEMRPADDISITGMLVSISPVLFVVFLSLYLHLNNVRTLLIAAFRCVVQLLLLGVILVPIFVYNEVYIVIPYLLVMVGFATREASVKPKHRYQGMRMHMFVAILVSISISLTVIAFGVLRPDLWYDAQVIIPVAGMMLGSSVNALSLGLDRFLVILLGGNSQRGSARLQTYLACGATPWETALPAVQQAIETGLTPNLNQMSVMGLVSIPGMFTGQILGGTPPLTAAKYQIVIMFFVVSNSTMILLLVLCQAISKKLFQNLTFQAHYISQRESGKAKDIVLAAFGHIAAVCQRLLQRKSDDVGRDEESVGQGNCRGDLSFRYMLRELRVHSDGFKYRDKKSLLNVSGGTISYAGKVVLQNFSFQLRSDEIAVLSGPSGCGKTSLLRSLATLESLESGILQFRGRGLSVPELRTNVLYVRQSGGQGLPGTPKQLVGELCALKSQRLRRLDDLEVENMLVDLLESIELSRSLLDRPWDQLSGGESQRVYLCVMIALQPEVLLLDEPTSACDPVSTQQVEDMILRTKKAVVWVSHDESQIDRLHQTNRAVLMRFERVNG